MERDIRLLEQKILIYIEKEEYEKASKLKEWLDDIKEIKKNKKKLTRLVQWLKAVLLL